MRPATTCVWSTAVSVDLLTMSAMKPTFGAATSLSPGCIYIDPDDLGMQKGHLAAPVTAFPPRKLVVQTLCGSYWLKGGRSDAQNANQAN